MVGVQEGFQLLEKVGIAHWIGDVKNKFRVGALAVVNNVLDYGAHAVVNGTEMEDSFSQGKNHAAEYSVNTACGIRHHYNVFGVGVDNLGE